MRSGDMVKEVKETLDMLHDIQEINAVLTSQWFDVQKAREIIMKHNQKDPIIYAHNNNPATMIPLSMASAELLYNSLQNIRNYLIAKRAIELTDAAVKGNENHADA